MHGVHVEVSALRDDATRMHSRSSFGHAVDLEQELHLDNQRIQNRSYIWTLSGFRAENTFGHPVDSEQKLHLDTLRIRANSNKV